MAVHLSFHLKGGEAAPVPGAGGGVMYEPRPSGAANHRRRSCQLRRVFDDEAGSFVYD